MKNVATLLALVLALGMIIYLYLQLSASQQQLAIVQRRADDCEKVTFMLQNKLSAQAREQAAAAGQPAAGAQK